VNEALGPTAAAAAVLAAGQASSWKTQPALAENGRGSGASQSRWTKALAAPRGPALAGLGSDGVIS
jgi:hypothetical protein